MTKSALMQVPAGWSLVPVGDLLTFKNGLNKGKEFFGYGTPIVNYMDVFKHSGLHRSDVKGLVDVTKAEQKAFSVWKGDVLFTRTSETPEEVGISSVLLENIEDAVFSGFLLRGRPISQILMPNFALYCFSSSVVRNQIISSATYTTRALTNGRILSKILLPIPQNSEEQEAIAEALSDADALIEELERLIAKKRLIKQGAMQELLTGRRRLPGFSGKWVKTALQNILLRISGGGTPSRATPEYWNGNIPWMTVKDFSIGSKVSTLENITEIGLNNSSSTQVPSGTLLLCTRMAVGKTIIMSVDVSINQDLKALFFVDDCVPRYYQLYFELRQEEIEEMSSGSTVKGVSIKDLQTMVMPKPSYAEQAALVRVFDDMDAEVQVLETHLKKARQIKEGMMQNLLTGQIRLV